MSRENVEVVRRAYGFLQSASSAMQTDLPPDPEAFAALFDPEFELVEVAEYPDADTYRGFDGFRRWLQAFVDIYDVGEVIPQSLDPVGTDTVIVRTHQRFRSKLGVALEQDVTHVWRLRDHRVTYVTGYREHANALQAVGRRE